MELFDSKRQERMQAVIKEITASKENAIKFLKEAGILLPDGQLAPHLRWKNLYIQEDPTLLLGFMAVTNL